MQVSICVSTRKRPEGLSRLIEGLNQLTFHRMAPPKIEVIVVDNDAAGSAAFCEKVQLRFDGVLKYDIEPEQGVSYTRNRTIANASAVSDFIAIIDDDEVPSPQWLEELLLTQRQYNVDIVAGPVLPHFEEQDVPKWIKKGEFFESHRLPTGHSMNVAFTNNVLIRSKVLKSLKQVFDERLATKGAEDTHLFMRLRKLGYEIVWSDEAIVTEWIPSSRTNLHWLLQRAYWGWSSYSMFEKELYPSFKLQFIRSLKGCGLIANGLLEILPAGLRGKHKFTQALLNIYRGLGTLSGLIGFQGDWHSTDTKQLNPQPQKTGIPRLNSLMKFPEAEAKLSSAPHLPSQTYDIVFHGNLRMDGNIAGITWFLTETLPIIRTVLPQAKVLIAGSSPTRKIRELCEKYEGVTLCINPSSTSEIYRSGRVMINPVKADSEMITRCLEVLALNKPIVSIPQGILGLPEPIKQHFRVATDSQSFAAEVIGALKARPESIISRELLESLFGNQAIEKVMSDIGTLS